MNKSKKSQFLEIPVEPYRVEAGLPADEVLRRMERISFQGRNLAAAHRLWQRMLGGRASDLPGRCRGVECRWAAVGHCRLDPSARR